MLNLAEFKDRPGHSRSAAPDQTFMSDKMVGAGDKVAVAWIWKGARFGDIAIISATDRPIIMSGLTIYYFKKRMLAGHRQIADCKGVYRQISY